MQVLVCGGTGFIGSRIVSELLTQRPGCQVRVLSRRVQIANPWGRRVEFVQANVTNPRTLENAVTGAEVAIQSVQFPNHPIENLEKAWTFMQVDAKGTRNLLDACKKSGVRRFIYLSAAGADSSRKERWFRAKGIAEEAVRESGIEHVILRPGCVYGPGDLTFCRLARLARFTPLVPIIGDGGAKLRPISVFDVARIAALSVSLPEAANQTFELGGPDELPVREVARLALEAQGKRRLLLPIPSAVFKLLAGFAAMLPSPPMSPAAVDFLLKQESPNSRRTEEVFGLRFEPLASGFRRCR